MRSLVPIVAAVTLVACAPKPPKPQWSNPGASSDQFAKDSYECALRHESTSMYRACLEAKGYRLVPGGELGPGVRN